MSNHSISNNVLLGEESNIHIRIEEELDLDDPLYVMMSTFPYVKDPKQHLYNVQCRIMSTYEIDLDEMDIETALNKVGITKLEFDIHCKGMIESEAEYLAYSRQMYENARGF